MTVKYVGTGTIDGVLCHAYDNGNGLIRVQLAVSCVAEPPEQLKVTPAQVRILATAKVVDL
jgi:hypothetical protein